MITISAVPFARNWPNCTSKRKAKSQSRKNGFKRRKSISGNPEIKKNWAKRIKSRKKSKMPKAIASIGKIPYQIKIKTPSGNELTADEPLDKGGKDTGFSPKELLAAALSACTSATL